MVNEYIRNIDNCMRNFIRINSNLFAGTVNEVFGSVGWVMKTKERAAREYADKRYDVKDKKNPPDNPSYWGEYGAFIAGIEWAKKEVKKLQLKAINRDDGLHFKSGEFKRIGDCFIPGYLVEKIVSYINNRVKAWEKSCLMLYGRYDEINGWEFHEKPGDMNTHTCRAFGVRDFLKDMKK